VWQQPREPVQLDNHLIRLWQVSTLCSWWCLGKRSITGPVEYSVVSINQWIMSPM